MKKRLFISHITEEKKIAVQLKTALVNDFLGLLDVFVSSDTDSIAAGEEWLISIESALRDCKIFVVLCSPDSIHRPWINFEAGAAWMRKIPLIPICHAGLSPHDLRMPLSLRQGIKITDSDGIQRLYKRIAHELGCDPPPIENQRLRIKDSDTVQQLSLERLATDRDIRNRRMASLENPNFNWRALKRVATEAALTQDIVADLLRSSDDVRFSKGKSGEIIVGLRSRVD